MRLFITPATMTRVVAVLAIAAMSLHGQPAKAPLPASVRDVSMVRLLDFGPHVMCQVEFKAIVRNDRQTEIRIVSEPVYFGGSDLGVDTGKGAGEWLRNVFGVMQVIDAKNHQCSVVPPGGTYELPNQAGTSTSRRSTGAYPLAQRCAFTWESPAWTGKPFAPKAS